MQRTACLIKPDAFPKRTPQIMERLFAEGFAIDIAGTFRFDQLMVDQFYHEHVGRSYYDNLSRFMISAPCLGMVLERDFAVETLRRIMGPAKIDAREPGQIRYELGDGADTARNCIHGSDSKETAAFEINLLSAFLHIGRYV